jgi:cytochrome c
MPTIKHSLQAGLVIALAASAFLPGNAQAQTCADPVAADFRVDTLAYNNTGDLYGGTESGNYGVVQIATTPEGKIFIAKMCSGDVRVYNPASGLKAATVSAGVVPTKCNNEDGLLGIVASHDYATTKWIYVMHTDAASVDFSNTSARNTDARAHVITRYTYDSTAAAGSQLKNPKVILRFNRIVDRQPYHAAGGLDISADGTLVIGTGDDTSPHSSNTTSTNDCPQGGYGPTFWPDRGCDAQRSSSNTNDLRGKILRIQPIAFPDAQTPTPGIGATYQIPPGNLWEKISLPAFNPNWNPTVDSVSKVRKEIYTMGHRNPYHPRIDSKSGWIFTGEVGSDAGSPSTTRGPEGREEWNLATEPGFYGHPYCVGKNAPWNSLDSAGGSGTSAAPWIAQYGSPYVCSAIQNKSPHNTGIRNLPPARAAIVTYSQASNNGDDSYRMGFNSEETAIGGPMYRYSPTLVSSVKFPPQYEGKVFFFDWSNTNKAGFRIISVNPDGTLDSGVAAVKASPLTSLAGLPAGSYIDMRFGADGAMYLLRNSTGGSGYSGFNQAALLRIAYTGTITPSCYTPFNATVGPPAGISGRPAIRRNVAPTLVSGFVNLPIGYKSVELYNLSGRKVWTYRRAAADHHEAVQVPASLGKGMLQAKLEP